MWFWCGIVGEDSDSHRPDLRETHSHCLHDGIQQSAISLHFRYTQKAQNEQHASSGCFRSLNYPHPSSIWTLMVSLTGTRQPWLVARRRGPTGWLAIGLDGTRELLPRSASSHQSSGCGRIGNQRRRLKRRSTTAAGCSSC
ncbi:hypothetical protein HDV57DRAFT_52624 [Trichoderma longibrachiatum]